MTNIMPIAYCKTCETPITVLDVVKEKDVRNASSHIVLIYSCPSCDKTDRIVGTRQAWADVQEAAVIEEVEEDLAISEDLLELSLINNVADISKAWAGAPPLIEEHMGKYCCDACERKLYGAR